MPDAHPCPDCGKPLQPRDDAAGRIFVCNTPECPNSRSGFRASSFQLERSAPSGDVTIIAAADTVEALTVHFQRASDNGALDPRDIFTVIAFNAGSAVPERVGGLVVVNGKAAYLPTTYREG
jgi:hypothetical protein